MKLILPRSVQRQLTGLFYGWHGNYQSWEKAKNKCTGYDSEKILEKVKASLLDVKNGNTVYERDSVIFNEVQYSYPLLAGLMWIAAQNNGRLNVLDFGGSLGSSYYQNKRFLDSLKTVNWCIVEQPGFVKIGIESFLDDRLHFYYTIEECLKSYNVDLVLLSSVLQYLEEPYKLIDEILSKNIKYLIIDRTPFVEDKDRITIQKVPTSIYKATYPCWFFNEEKFVSFFSQKYKLVFEFDALDKANIPSKFKGYIFQKIAL